MARDFDAQLLESVAVRRRRLRDALSWGSMRTRRAASNLTARLVIGAAVASVICAGCVGWSFRPHQHSKQDTRATGLTSPAVAR